MQNTGFGEWLVWVKVVKKKEMNPVKQKLKSDFFGTKSVCLYSVKFYVLGMQIPRKQDMLSGCLLNVSICKDF